MKRMVMKKIDIQTHIGKDMDAMCLFLNKNRIGYRVGECHYFIGCPRFKDYPQYTAWFTIEKHSKEGFARVFDTIRKYKDITFYMETFNEPVV